MLFILTFFSVCVNFFMFDKIRAILCSFESNDTLFIKKAFDDQTSAETFIKQFETVKLARETLEKFDCGSSVELFFKKFTNISSALETLSLCRDGSRALEFISTFSAEELAKKSNPMLSRQWTNDFSLLTHFGFLPKQIEEFFKHFSDIVSIRLLYSSDMDAQCDDELIKNIKNRDSTIDFIFNENVCDYRILFCFTLLYFMYCNNCG